MKKYVLYQNDLPDNFNVSGKEIAIDTETMGLSIKCDRLCLVQIADLEKICLIQFRDQSYNAPNLKNILSDNSITKIFHFARFDVSVLNHNLKLNIQNIYCTKIASKLVRTYTDAHGLKDLCNELLGVNISKNAQSSYWGDEQLTQEQLKYAASDVEYLHAIKDRLDAIIKRENKQQILDKCNEFLLTRSYLDLIWNSSDIFKH